MDVESLTKELLAYYFSISMHVCVLSHFSHVWLCVTLWTAACQATNSLAH